MVSISSLSPDKAVYIAKIDNKPTSIGGVRVEKRVEVFLTDKGSLQLTYWRQFSRQTSEILIQLILLG